MHPRYPLLALLLGWAVGFASGVPLGCAAQRQAVDLGSYAADEFACVEREPKDACVGDKPACKARIDACFAEVRARYGVTVDGSAER